MSRATFFFKRLITLAVSVFIFFVADYYTIIPFYISIAILNLAFALISSRISGVSPKELYNFHRNEKYFAKGGMRDLLRIPVMLFSFLHDIIVWEIWGLYQIFEMLIDIVTVIKEAIYWIFYAIIWFLKLLVPFWRITLRMFVFYLIKWPWWIFTYAFQNMRIAFKWNMFRIALPGAFLFLFVVHFFYFLDVTFYISGITLIGFILALLPLSWVFGEIASVRAQEMENSDFKEIKLKFRNGIETVRGILTYLSAFVVLLFLQSMLNAIGWIPKAGFILLGVVINFNFLINILLLALSILILIGTIILPSYRLYNEYSETNIGNSLNLISFIGKRIFQYISGLVPASIFSVFSIIPATIVVSIALFLTVTLKNTFIDAKIKYLVKKENKTDDQGEEIRLSYQIKELESNKRFPAYQIFTLPTTYVQQMKHRPLLKAEVENDTKRIDQLSASQNKIKTDLVLKISRLDTLIMTESQKNIVNQTRVEELKAEKARTQQELKSKNNSLEFQIQNIATGRSFKIRRLNQLPYLFYFSGLFYVIVTSLIFSFLLAYLGNFYYNSFIFRNDGTKAMWKQFIADEQRIDHKQPLLSTTLNIFLIITAFVLIWGYGHIPLVF